MEDKTNILIVEDDDRLAEHIQVHLKRDERNFRSVSNSKDALEELRRFSPNLVLLDLKIYESNDSESVPDILHGIKVAKEVCFINDKRQGQNIQIILVTGSLEHEYVRQLADQGMHVYARLEKDSKTFYEDLKHTVESALKNPTHSEKIIIYDGISEELLNSLRNVNHSLADILKHFVLKSYNSKQYFECIVRVASFTKCLYKEFTMNVADIKAQFNNFNKESDQGKKKSDDKSDWLRVWDELVEKNIIRDIDKQFAIGAIRARGKLAHDHEKIYSMGDVYTLDDAATVLQLLVPLIKKYIEFKMKK